MASIPLARANDWNNTGTGYWDNAANWNGGVPNAGGGWAIGNVANGGTAVITNAVPNVNEAWAGNGANGGPSGGAGNFLVKAGGTLSVNNWLVVARMCCPSTTACPLSILTVDGGTINKGGDGFIVGDTAGGLTGLGGTGELIAKGNSLINVTGGWFSTCPGGYSRATVSLQDNAVFNVPGLDFNIGDWGNGRTTFTIKDKAQLTISRLWVGKWDDTVAVLQQSGGSIIGSGANPDDWRFGGNGGGSPQAFAYYGKSGGSLNTPWNFQMGAYGRGICYQTGGTNTFGGWTSIGRYSGGFGVVWISGGRFEHVSAGSQVIIGEEGHGEFNLSGTGVLDCRLKLRITNPNGAGIVNLNGGTAAVLGIEQSGSAGYLNFNGGTLKAKANNASFMSGLTDARIYSGNAIFDTDGYDITIAQALSDGAGSGVISIPVSNAGSGYMAPPIVQLSGDGSGATAVAEIDAAVGTVTNVLITCPGYNYSTAAATLLGGGGTTAATLGTPTVGTVNGGGVVKNGAGSLTLTGNNAYSGSTVVNKGLLVLTPNAYVSGPVTVANGAGFGVALVYAYTQLGIPSLALGTSAGTTLRFDVGNFGNPSAAPLSVTGNLAVNGPVTVNIADALPQVGQFALMQYGSRSGAGSFVLGTLPAGVEASLVDDSLNQILYLNITTVGLPRWEGLAGGFWDIGRTENWIEQSTGSAAFYNDGAPVLFNDEALGLTTVNLVTNVKPASVTITNMLLNYTIFGTGKISGASSFVKQGTGTVSVVNWTLNDYTGPTIIEGGTLAVTNLANGGSPSAIGKASSAATNLVLSGGTLSYAGPAVAIDRGYVLQAPNSAIDAQSDLVVGGRVTADLGGGFVKKGPAKLTYTAVGVNELSDGAFPGYNVAAGTVVFDGSAGGQTNHNQNEFWVGGATTSGATVILTNTTLNVDSWVSVSRGNGTFGNVSSLSLYNSVLQSGAFSMGYDGAIVGNLAQQFLTLNGSSVLTNNGDMNVGESGGSSSSVLLTGTSSVYSAGRIQLGWHNNATGAITMAQSSKLTVNAWFPIGNEGGVGSVTMKDNSSLWVASDLNVTDVNAGDGTFNLQDNAVASVNNWFVGKGVGSSGVVHQTGGSVVGRLSGNEIQIGFHGAGTWNLSGGTIQASNHWFVIGRYTDGPGILNVTGGTIRHASTSGKLFRVGEEGTGTLNLSGTGDIETFGDTITVGPFSTGNGTINLDGGSLLARRIIGGAGTSRLNFNGGLLRVGPSPNADFMSSLGGAYVLAGGARIDTAGNNVTIVQPLLDGGSGGGLTKTGNGTLALDGINTYTGTTTVSAGTLAGNGTLAGPVVVSASGTLSPGASIGTLTIAGPLSLGGTTLMELNKSGLTNDSVVGVGTLTYGGTLVLKNLGGQLAIGDSFKLFGATTYGGLFASVVSDTPGQTVTWDTSKLALDGTVSVLTVVTIPVHLTSTVSGGNLMLSWPTSQIGYELQTQANPLTIGVSTNWTVVPGSTATNEMSFPINPASGSTFFRLLFP